jgi:GAF domain-containing protein
MRAPLPANEAERLHTLQRYAILDTAAEQEFDDLVRLAAHICDTPVAAVTFIDRERQWLKARLGIDANETSRDLAFCAHTILDPQVMLEVEDTLQDPRFADHPGSLVHPGSGSIWALRSSRPNSMLWARCAWPIIDRASSLTRNAQHCRHCLVRRWRNWNDDVR